MIFSLVFPFIFSLTSIFHPYYVSVTEINHNKKNRSIEITSKIFTDDLEKALSQKYNTKVDLINPKDKEATEKLIADYLKAKLILTMKGNALNFNLIGYEIEEDAVWCYAEAPIAFTPNLIQIKNTILYEYKKDQLNIMHVTINDQRKSVKLQNPEEEIKISF